MEIKTLVCDVCGSNKVKVTRLKVKVGTYKTKDSETYEYNTRDADYPIDICEHCLYKALSFWHEHMPDNERRKLQVPSLQYRHEDRLP